MELMLDSANIKEIKEIKNAGLLGGLTTNPSLIKRALSEMNYRGHFYGLAREILSLTEKRPVFFQTTGQTQEEILDEARRIYNKLSPFGNPFIKIPINSALIDNQNIFSGVSALKILKREGIPTLATAIVLPSQALLAGLLGADYAVLMLRNYDNIIAEKLGLKLEEKGYLTDEETKPKFEEKGLPFPPYLSGISTLKAASKIFKNNNLETKLIIAGIRNLSQLDIAFSEEGVRAITIPYKLFREILSQEGTKRFIKQTSEDAPPIYRKFIKND